jgi:hypothetical protein
VFAKNRATKKITTVPRNRENEFRIILLRHIVGTDILLPKPSFYFPYSTPFYLWLSTLRGETGLGVDASTGARFALEGYFWLYKLVDSGKVGNKWHCVKGELSYLDMLENLKKAQGIAFLVHVGFLSCFARAEHLARLDTDATGSRSCENQSLLTPMLYSLLSKECIMPTKQKECRWSVGLMI